MLESKLASQAGFNINQYKKPIDVFITTLSIVVMIGLVFCVVWQVFSRLILKSPSTLTDEVARFSMIWVGLLGASYTYGLKKHLAIDLLTHDLLGIKRLLSQLLINISVLFFSISVMIYGGLKLLFKVYETGQTSPAMQLPMAYIYIVLPLSGLIIAYYSVLFCIEAYVTFKLEKSTHLQGEKP